MRSHQTRMKRYAQMIYMLCQCKDAIDNPAALFARMRRLGRRALSVWHKFQSWKIWTLADIHAALTNQELALAVTCYKRRQKIQNNNGGQINLVVCGYPELSDNTLYFYKNRNKFCNEPGAAWQKPLPWREFVSVVLWISHANEASKLKLFKRPTTLE